MRFSFRLKIALLTATLSAVPLLTAGWLLIDVNAREVESSTQALQIALVEQVRDRADEELAGAEATLTAIASSLGNGALTDETRLAIALRLLDAEPAVDMVAVYDGEGALIDRMHDPQVDAVTPDSLPSEWRDAANEGRTLGAIERDGESVRALLIVPVRAGREATGEAGEVTGYAVAPWSLRALQSRITSLSGAQLASREGVLMLVADDRILAHPDPARLLEPAPPVPAGSLRAPSSAERADADGRAWLETAVGSRSLPWTVVASIPADVAYASLREMRVIVVSTIAFTLLVALIAAFVFARRITAPITALVDFTRELAARRFDGSVRIDTHDELSLLGEALTSAAAELGASEARIREETAIRNDLRRYLPSELVEQIVRRERSMELGGERRSITVLFADVVAFTPLSDRLPPEQVVAILNELFTLLTEAVFRHEGTVDKFVGDCVMALFGAPTAHEDHATRALFAAQDMFRFLESANVGWKERYGVTIELAIGINTGDAVVGNVGSETRMEYTAIGDVVNVAARLEAIARPQQILVSRATSEAADGELFETRPVGAREVPGRKEAVELLEVAW